MTLTTDSYVDHAIHLIREAAEREDFHDDNTTAILVVGLHLFATVPKLINASGDELRKAVYTSLMKRASIDMAQRLYPHLSPQEMYEKYYPEETQERPSVLTRFKRACSRMT